MNWPFGYINKEVICTVKSVPYLTWGKSYRVYDAIGDGDGVVNYVFKINDDGDSKQEYPVGWFVPKNCNCTCPQCMVNINRMDFSPDNRELIDSGQSIDISSNRQLYDGSDPCIVDTNIMKEKEDKAMDHKYGKDASLTGSPIYERLKEEAEVNWCPVYVKCIEQSIDLTLDKMYKVIESGRLHYCIINDSGDDAWYGKDRFEECKEYINKPNLSTSEIRVDNVSQSKAPHCCPVCCGRGLMPPGFYQSPGQNSWVTSNTIPEQCKSCTGSGVVWG